MMNKPNQPSLLLTTSSTLKVPILQPHHSHSITAQQNPIKRYNHALYKWTQQLLAHASKQQEQEIMQVKDQSKALSSSHQISSQKALLN
ncbi:hypothetical protein O181_078211 [Austropuccinia psidii MF-1]|uniref:Uncharacterized protein n=1 Tax=Austropuccinia psidii MF-1 TaxID=1389203 RepID=A0A9Q3ICU2_9BASI|nr:hypothetical protein [Austropuccinia psidii MF-1]